jgi:hypothetical protein
MPQKISPDTHQSNPAYDTGPVPTSHTAGVRFSECEEGEPPRKERTTARGSAPLHLRRKQWPSL